MWRKIRMKIINLKCSQCGADMKIYGDSPIVKCEYCGNQMIIDDEVQRSEVTIKGGYSLGREFAKGALDENVARIEAENKRVERRILFLKVGQILKGVLAIPIVYLLCTLFQMVVNTKMISENTWIFWVILAVAEFKVFKDYKDKFSNL